MTSSDLTTTPSIDSHHSAINVAEAAQTRNEEMQTPVPVVGVKDQTLSSDPITELTQCSGENAESESSEHPNALLTEEASSEREGPGAAKVPEEDERLEPILENISILAHLALFAIIGICIRYALEIAFGPSGLHITDDSQALFLDIPPNMLGSFIMGIVGYVMKQTIAEFSQPLAIGLSTGLCGSITTYASWNQRMMAILAYGLVARALFGYILGTALAYYSFLVGVDTADGMFVLTRRYNERRRLQNKKEWAPSPEHYQRRWLSLLTSVTLTLLLLIAAAVLFALESSSPKLRKASLACLCGPFGCWLRWFLSWRNGQGVGSQGKWKWVPVGTLAANILAVTIEGATSAIDAVHNTELGSLLVGGFQLGFMGCLSTVSTLMQEVHILSKAKVARWRAYVYLYLLTFLPSILIGLLAYCMPVWVFDSAANGYNKADPADQANLFKEFK